MKASHIHAWLICLLCLAGCAERREAADPETRLARGWDYYRLAEWNRALQEFGAVRDAATDNAALRRRATYAQATTWNLRRPGDDRTRARQLYDEILKTDPKSEEAAWSALALARMVHLVPVGQEPDYPAVRKAYQQVIDKYPGHLVAEEAFIYQQSTLVATLREEDARKALAALEEFVRTHPKSGLLHSAYGLIAQSCATLKNPRGRLDAEIKGLEVTDITANPLTEHTWTYWRIATIAEFDAGDFDTARRFYRKLIDEYPNDSRLFAARQAIARMDGIEEQIRKEMGN